MEFCGRSIPTERNYWVLHLDDLCFGNNFSYYRSPGLENWHLSLLRLFQCPRLCGFDRGKKFFFYSRTSGTSRPITEELTFGSSNLQNKKRKYCGAEMVPEIIAENFPNLETDKLIQEADWIPKTINSKKFTQRHIIIKLQKIKDHQKCIKATRDDTLQIRTLWIIVDFSSETTEAKRAL